MLKFVVFYAMISFALANHLGPSRWNVVYTYSGNSCQGDPILVSAVLNSCVPSTTLSCLPDVAPNEGTSFTQVCVSTLRNFVKTLPKNYATEVVYRTSEGNNCTNPQGVIGVWMYGLNTCIPTPYGVNGNSWRTYTSCNATVMNAATNCTTTSCNSCSFPFSRETQGSCYQLSASSTVNTGTYYCNSIPESILDVVAPASALKPAILVILLLVLMLSVI